MPGDNRVACRTVSTVAKGLPVQLGASQKILGHFRRRKVTCSQTPRIWGERGENPGAGEVEPYLHRHLKGTNVPKELSSLTEEERGVHR